MLGIFRKNDGSLVVPLAIMLPVIIGFIGLAIDSGSWYVEKRDLQVFADSIAASAAHEIAINSKADLSNIGKLASSQENSTDYKNVKATINNPPLSGKHAGDDAAVEVIISRPKPRFLSALFLTKDPIITTRSVALRRSAADACILALNSNISGAVGFSRSGYKVILANCSVASNSKNPSAISISGNTKFIATGLHSVGNYSVAGSVDKFEVNEIAINSSPVPDPYKHLPRPVPQTGCDYNGYQATGTMAIVPGVYCNGLTFSSDSRVIMKPGIYYINGGTLRFDANANVVGAGVTIILTGSSVATMQINSWAIVSLAPAFDGIYRNILIYQDPNASPNTLALDGGTSNRLMGVIYAPKAAVSFSGNNASSPGCLKIVADSINFSGDTDINNNCASNDRNILVPGYSVRVVE